MKKVNFTLTNETGLHARPATLFEAEAQRFVSEITIEKDGETFDAKSIIDILCAAAAKGDTITITADGSDEDEAVTALLVLLASFTE
jgi:phosphocarrier protein HPr